MNTTRSVRIELRGRLSRRLATVFDGLTVVECGAGSAVVGDIRDQAELHGLLTRIRDLGIELESVTTTVPGQLQTPAVEPEPDAQA